MTGTVEIRNVVKRFGKVEAVRDVSFSLPEGETVALVGHNGAGKTTLMKLMLGLIRPTRGHIAVLGDDPAAGEFAARRRLGYLPENVSFNAALTGRETLAFYARLKREPAKRRCAALLERVGLDARRRPARRDLLQGHAPAPRARPGAARRTRASSCSTSRPPASTRPCATASTRSSRSCAGAARRCCCPRTP